MCHRDSFYTVLRFKPRALCMSGKDTLPTEPHPQPCSVLIVTVSGVGCGIFHLRVFNSQAWQC